METLVAILQGISVLVVGIVSRVAIVLAVAAVLLAPVALALGLVRAFRWARRRVHAHAHPR
ncbi:MAG: hypothetical protein ACJ79R_04080 [Anaeromyxobacteraceae bacterium]